MKTIVLISCSKSKLTKMAKAKDLYRGDLFVKSLQYAYSLHPDLIYIASAKHYLLNPDELVDPYDLTLNRMPASAVKEWAEEVIAQLQQVVDLDSDRFILLMGERYRRYLLPHLTRYEIPMKGLSIGRQLHFLKAQKEQKEQKEQLAIYHVSHE